MPNSRFQDASGCLRPIYFLNIPDVLRHNLADFVYICMMIRIPVTCGRKLAI